MPPIVAPSMLSADFGNLDRDIALVNESKAGLFHLDIMDGVFVPNISFGFPVIKAIAEKAKKPLDAHLMIVNPERYIDAFKDAGVSYLSVHIEAATHLHRVVEQIQRAGMLAGVALNPHTPISSLEEIIAYVDFILLMSVNPGFSSQKFIPTSVQKIEKLKNLTQQFNPDCLIEVDGGVNIENAPVLVKAGADILVAGNAVFGSENPIETIAKLGI